MLKLKQMRHSPSIFSTDRIIFNHSQGFKIDSFSSITKKILGSKIQGVPSSSTNLKEALCEKIPLYYDLLRTFRKEYDTMIVSKITVKNLYEGLAGVNTIVKETAETDPQLGLMYRGLSIPDIIKLLPHRGLFPTPEAIFWLLLTGDVPTDAQTSFLISDWTNRREKLKFRLKEIQNLLQTLPNNVGPITVLSVILATTDSPTRHLNPRALISKSYAHWEYIYEDSMDILATLPVILALVKNPQCKYTGGTNDWINVLVESLSSTGQSVQVDKSSIEDFLKLIVVLNADENGGVPSSHISQILGSCQNNPAKALAASFLALANEPTSGTLHQCISFQEKVRRLLGANKKENILRGIVGAFMQNPRNFPGYEISNVGDARFKILQEFAQMNEASAMHLSVQCYGYHDMEFNQALICMARALGLLASIIWNKIINLSVEKPNSQSTRRYMKSLEKQ